VPSGRSHSSGAATVRDRGFWERLWPDALDPGGGDVFGLGANERHTMGKHLLAHLPANGRIRRQYAMENDVEATDILVLDDLFVDERMI
jgi:hypothetical protein